MMKKTDPSFITEMLSRKWSIQFNCYTLLQEVYETQWGIVIPECPADPINLRAVLNRFEVLEHGNDPKDDIWTTVDAPEHGDAVLFGRKYRVSHIGVWLDYDGGLILHCSRKIGVTCGDLMSLQKYGFTNPVYKRYVRNN